jgi:hypothetical protein
VVQPLGPNRQLLLAREMWKRCNLEGRPPADAAMVVARDFASTAHNVRNCYYRFRRGDRARALYVELAMNCLDDPVGWSVLARGDTTIFAAAIDKLEEKLKAFRVAKTPG